MNKTHKWTFGDNMQTEYIKNKTIPIALATDERYLAPTLVAVRSIALTSNNIFNYKIFVFSEKKLNYFAKKGLLSTVKKHRNIQIEFLPVGEKLGSLKISLDGPVKGVTTTTYLRFFLPDLLPNIKKIIYLDADTVVLGDIAELFNIELGECFVGGVRDIIGQENKKERCSELNIPDIDHYINAGVLLMDLDKFRRKNLSNKMLCAAQNKSYSYNDQDIINSICYGSILCIAYKFNVIVDYLNNPSTISEKLNIDYLKETVKPTIMHYAGRTKPWYFPKEKWSLFWWDIINTLNAQTKIFFKLYMNRLTKNRHSNYV